MSNYTPGTVVTVGALAVGDSIFLRERRAVGLAVPTHPATVTELVPSTDGRVLVRVKSANAGSDAAPRVLGQLPATREFRRAVAVI
ncbi:hypothetical protein QMG83_09005 [Salinibacterium sp. G-O1]|uniref:hypothetical protein n=1 Tax=Salinibacterium sp. G-O1 TaxID=3046208 RepID=UPI0024BA93ED|nr:hypothetical protein [Salinibacterium sp. G-O1]MDJ0335360.1 hypothetical protein [Salinibacterium sp. G-O1]